MLMNKQRKKDCFLYIGYTFAWLLVHFVCKRCGDDLVWMDFAENPSIERILEHYISYMSTWSSRLIIDFVGIIVEVLPMMVWRILDTLAIVFLTFQIDMIFNERRESNTSLFVMCSCFLYPFIHMVSAGWMATTFTYLWPLSCAAYVVRIWKKNICDKTISKREYIISVFLFLYAIDNQQVALFMMIICFGIAVVLRRNRRNSVFVNAMLAISVIRIVLHLIWPGSTSRMIAETKTWFPDYGMLNIVDRLQIGVASICDIIFKSNSLVFVLMCGMMSVVVWQKHKDMVYRVIALFPTVLVVIFGPLRVVVEKYFPRLYILEGEYSDLYGMVSNNNYFRMSSYISFFILGLGVICIFTSILLVFDDLEESVLFCTVLLAGLCSRGMMGLSPTVVASGARTHIYMYFVFIVLLIAFTKKLLELCEKKAIVALWVIYILGGLSYINTFGETYLAG